MPRTSRMPVTRWVMEVNAPTGIWIRTRSRNTALRVFLPAMGSVSARRRAVEGLAFRGNASDEVVPRLVERLRAFDLKLIGQCCVVHSPPPEFVDQMFGIATVDRQRAAQPAMIGKREQRL